ncbi:response regulator [bacterium]|nr:response regulator [bacterium]MBU1989889.1 response regulator [bacterium]
MENDLNLLVKNLARNASILIVDDDEFTLDIYESVFSTLFLKIYTAKDGQEAFDLWMDQNKNIDIIVTDMMMPTLNGFEFINKIRENSNSQHVLVLTSLDDLNEMLDIVNLGVDGIIPKPYSHEKVFPVLARVLEVIKAKKTMKRQIFQLKLLSQEKVTLKASAKNKAQDISKENIKVAKEADNKLSAKYNIRKTIQGADALSLSNTIDYSDMDNIDALISSLHEYEASIVELEGKPANEIIDNLISSTDAISTFLNIIGRIGSFEVAYEAGKHLIEFIKNINASELEDSTKKELFFDAYLSMFQDIDSWLEVVFINKEASNVNYFDASFANTCLELEAIFADKLEDDSELEFF